MEDSYWRDVRGIRMLSHGSWSDPELMIERGCFRCIANYYDIEDSQYAWCKDEMGTDYADDDATFNTWCQEHHEFIIADIKTFGKWERI